MRARRSEVWITYAGMAVVPAALLMAVLVNAAGKNWPLSGWSRFGLRVVFPCLMAPALIVAIVGLTVRTRRRQAARVRHGACVWCGYALDELDPQRVERGGSVLRLVACPECGRWNSTPLRFINIAAELDPWPSKERLAEILRSAGLTPVVGRHSVRIAELPGFAFQHMTGDLDAQSIEAGVGTVRESVFQATRVSAALAGAGVRHRFELYEDLGPGKRNNLVGYLHHDWPREQAVS